jgi:hypothetical protein
MRGGRSCKSVAGPPSPARNRYQPRMCRRSNLCSPSERAVRTDTQDPSSHHNTRRPCGRARRGKRNYTLGCRSCRSRARGDTDRRTRGRGFQCAGWRQRDDYGARGWIAALAAGTGHDVWRRFSTGRDLDVGIDAGTRATGGEPDAGLHSWSNDGWQHGGGESVGTDRGGFRRRDYLPRRRPCGALESRPAPRRQPVDFVTVCARREDRSVRWVDQPIDSRKARVATTTRDICPAWPGGTIEGAALSGDANLVFIPVSRLCMDLEARNVSYIPGTAFVGANVQTRRPSDGMGALVARDIVGGKAAWSVAERFPIAGGVLATNAIVTDRARLALTRLLAAKCAFYQFGHLGTSTDNKRHGVRTC